jgi:hypothetical protein
MVMIDAPPHFVELFAVGAALCFIFGKYCSNHNLWTRWFPTSGKDAFEVYAKRGEYGEYELAKKGVTELKGSPFMEPLNAWTSLSYSVFGFVIFATSVSDYYARANDEPAPNRTAMFPEFGLLYGASSIWLGIASFMFHASHAEPWRKADAGMTSGVVVALVAFALWDRLRPPGMDATVLVLLAALLQFSLTHGYLPYGSSDTLLPTLVGIAFAVELLPRYGGPVDPYQYYSWAATLYGTLCGMLLRLADIKRENKPMFTKVTRILMVITVFPFGYYLGPFHPVIIFGVLGMAWVLKEPSRGHIWWHLGSSYALFGWWYMLRTRPDDPIDNAVEPDTMWWAVLWFGVIKNAVRRIFFVLPFPTERHRDRLFFTIEHIVWTLWGYYVIYVEPETQAPGSSWLFNHDQIWVMPTFPSKLFHLYYLAKTGGALEDLVYRWVAIANHKKAAAAAAVAVESETTKTTTKTRMTRSASAAAAGAGDDAEDDSHITYSESDASGKSLLLPKPAKKEPLQEAHESDLKMDIHHLATALLCGGSLHFGYCRVGSDIMFVHDLTDIPLDLVRLFGCMNWLNMQALAMFITLGSWAYWRLYYLLYYLWWSTAYDTKEEVFGHPCYFRTFPIDADCGDFNFMIVNIWWPILVMLLVILHYIWYAMMVRKTYIELWVKRKGRR